MTNQNDKPATSTYSADISKPLLTEDPVKSIHENGFVAQDMFKQYAASQPSIFEQAQKECTLNVALDMAKRVQADIDTMRIASAPVWALPEVTNPLPSSSIGVTPYLDNLRKITDSFSNRLKSYTFDHMPLRTDPLTPESLGLDTDPLSGIIGALPQSMPVISTKNLQSEQHHKEVIGQLSELNTHQARASAMVKEGMEYLVNAFACLTHMQGAIEQWKQSAEAERQRAEEAAVSASKRAMKAERRERIYQLIIALFAIIGMVLPLYQNYYYEQQKSVAELQQRQHNELQLRSLQQINNTLEKLHNSLPPVTVASSQPTAPAPTTVVSQKAPAKGFP